MKSIAIVFGALLAMNGAALAVDMNLRSGGKLIIGSKMVVNGNAALFSGATFQTKIESAVPVTGYGQLEVKGTVDLGNSTLMLSGAHVPIGGQSFTLIDNDDVDAVTGTFNGLPQGSAVTFNGMPLSISYTGGTGNDVVLSRTLPPPVTLAATAVSSGWATLNGSADPYGLPSTAYFEYGLTTGYGSTTFSNSIGSGTAVVPVSFNIAGLTWWSYRGASRISAAIRPSPPRRSQARRPGITCN
jgi:hypothetical protein